MEKKSDFRFQKRVELWILILAFLLSNHRALFFGSMYPNTHTWLSEAWLEIGLWMLVLGAAFWVMQRQTLLSAYARRWQKNGILVFFLLFTLLSAVWSIDPLTTIYRSLSVLSAAMVGAYIGTYYDMKKLLKYLYGFGSMVAIASYETVLLAPAFGKSLGEVYDGAWRGIFWHRNHLGGMVALLNLVFLMRFVSGWKTKNKELVLDGIFYIASLVLVFLSRSATGEIMLILMNAAVILVLLWQRFSSRLRQVHYYGILAIALLSSLLAIVNRGFIFGLFNRSANMTGRIPMWEYLWTEFILKRLAFGYGFGASWAQETFRTQMQTALGWKYPLFLADNGYLDILLHLGIAGLALFCLVLGLMVIRAVRYAITNKQFLDFFPALLVLFALVANIPYSWFMELEVFVWMLLVAVLFQTTQMGAAPTRLSGTVKG